MVLSFGIFFDSHRFQTQFLITMAFGLLQQPTPLDYVIFEWSLMTVVEFHGESGEIQWTFFNF